MIEVKIFHFVWKVGWRNNQQLAEPLRSDRHEKIYNNETLESQSNLRK